LICVFNFLDNASVYSSTNQVFQLQYWVNGTSGSSFGYSVAASDDYFVVGAPTYSGGIGSGAAYVYDEFGVLYMTLSGDSVSQSFGAAVAITDDLVAVASVNSELGSFTAVVYIYGIVNTSRLQVITLSQTVATTRLGGSLCLYHDILAVGDYTYGSQNGAVFIYQDQDFDSDYSANFTYTQVRCDI
jgi:hypothetical protein